MSKREMTVEEFGRWAAEMMAVDRKSWKPELRAARKILRGSQKTRLRAHVDPAGRPWRKIQSKPAPKVGQRAPLLLPKGVPGPKRGIVIRRIRGRADKLLAMRMRKVFGPPLRDVPALVRTRKAPGAKKAVKIRNYLTRGWRAFKIGKNWMTYGYKNGTRWVEQLHAGAVRKGTKIPARRIVGFSKRDTDRLAEIFVDGYLRRVMK